MTPLKSLASVAVPDASTLMISPFDKSALKEIEKAINSSDLGLNPSNDGERIRLSIPQMTQVRELVRVRARQRLCLRVTTGRRGWALRVCM